MNNMVSNLLAAVMFILIAGCSSVTPIGANHKGYDSVYAEVNKTSITSNGYGSWSRIVLRRYGLEESYRQSPHQTIIKLHKYAMTDKRRDILYALAELSYYQGKIKSDNFSKSEYADGADYFLLSTLYSFYYLTDDSFMPEINSFDGGFRKICDFYNLSLPQALVWRSDDKQLLVESATRVIAPFGKVKINIVDKTEGVVPVENFTRYTASDSLSLRGMSMRVRENGLGSPVIGEERIQKGETTIGKGYGLTLIMTPNNLDFESKKGLAVNLQIFSPLTARSFKVKNNDVPLEIDLTAPFAYGLNQNFYWDLGLTQFLKGKQLIDNGMYQLQPYQPGKIPVILVHGTMSSPVTWAELWNTLNADPLVRDKFQFWYYSYDSGKPVISSAKHLVKSINKLKLELDPESKDPAIDNMVVIGHSQGGLLTRLTVTDTGESIIKTVTKGKSIDELNIRDEFKKDLRDQAVFEALPCVKRVVYIATPHRGSSLVNGFTTRIARWFITLPMNTIQNTADIVKGLATLELGDEFREIKYRTSIQSMSPNNPALISLAKREPADWVTVNSIVAVKDIHDKENSGDGVVKYSSAHLANADSEFVIQSGHSCLNNPLVIEEVRKRLLEHHNQNPPDK